MLIAAASNEIPGDLLEAVVGCRVESPASRQRALTPGKTGEMWSGGAVFAVFLRRHMAVWSLPAASWSPETFTQVTTAKIFAGVNKTKFQPRDFFTRVHDECLISECVRYVLKKTERL